MEKIEPLSFEFSLPNGDITEMSNIFNALSSPIRLQILRAISVHSRTLTEIAKLFNLPLSSASFHLNALVNAGLLLTEVGGKQGQTKWYTYKPEKKLILILREDTNNSSDNRLIIEEIPIGSFTDINPIGKCGMATDTNIICDMVLSDFFKKERQYAQIIWLEDGGITYTIRNTIFAYNNISEIEISLEICSEAVGYNNNFPSDITISLNGIDLVTHSSRGDYGDRYGNLTPSWWYKESTKYGHLVSISIKNDGIYLDSFLVNKKINLNSILESIKGLHSKLNIYIKPDAKHRGGLNIFGDKFGDYPQHILIKVHA